ncbi:MAG: hypothetical protein KF797_13625 [Flavobacteriales bacterium]|nr:hypothetical protein [Flavobacteriales bacterium]
MTIKGHPTTTIMRPLLMLILALALPALRSQAQQGRFDIWKGDAIIGSVLTERVVNEDRTRYLMTSYSEFDLVWKQVVRSLVWTEYRNGVVSSCHTRVKVNGTVRDSSHFGPKADEAHCFVHPDERFVHEGRVEWTTARMYFEEPIGQRSIFVESVLKHCALKNTGPGTYRLVLPGDKVNTYTYRNGRLEEVHVDRSFFDLVFKRDS